VTTGQSVPSERRTEPLARRGVDRTDRCPDVDQRTQPVDDQDNQCDQNANVAAIQASTLPAGGAASSPQPGGYGRRDDADDALCLNRQCPGSSASPRVPPLCAACQDSPDMPSGASSGGVDEWLPISEPGDSSAGNADWDGWDVRGLLGCIWRSPGQEQPERGDRQQSHA
jgi:hypothetical protein